MKETKSNFEEIRDYVIKFLAITFGLCAVRAVFEKIDDAKFDKEFKNNTSNVGIAVIHDGEVYYNNEPQGVHFIPSEFYKVDNPYGEISVTNYCDVEYQIQYIDSDYAIIYTYADNDDIRNCVMGYILNNVQIDENNQVIINEDQITQEGFIEYQNNILNSYTVEENISRVRD